MTESIQMPDPQPMTESTQTPDPARQMLKDSIATAEKLLRRMGEDLHEIESFIYVSIAALHPRDRNDTTEDVAKVLDATYVRLVEQVNDDVRNALNALGEAGRACSGVVTSRDQSDVWPH